MRKPTSRVLHLEKKNSNKILVISVDPSAGADIDLFKAQEIAEEAKKVVHDGPIILDFKGLSHLHSMGFWALIDLAKEARQRNHQCIAINACPKIATNLTVTIAADSVTLADDLDSALEQVLNS